MSASQSAREEEIRQSYKERVAHFKVPSTIRFVKELPMTVTGRVQNFCRREIL